MATIKQVISDSLLVLNAETPYSPADSAAYERAFRQFKSFIQVWYEQGLGIFTGSDFSDIDGELPVIDQAYTAIVYNFAKFLAPIFRLSFTQEMVMMAYDSENDIRALYGASVSSKFPANLPIGAGNESDQFDDYHYYPDCDPEMYADDCDDCGDNLTVDASGIKANK